MYIYKIKYIFYVQKNRFLLKSAGEATNLINYKPWSEVGCIASGPVFDHLHWNNKARSSGI